MCPAGGSVRFIKYFQISCHAGSELSSTDQSLYVQRFPSLFTSETSLQNQLVTFLYSFFIYMSPFNRNIIRIIVLKPDFNVQLYMKIYKNKVGSVVYLPPFVSLLGNGA